MNNRKINDKFQVKLLYDDVGWAAYTNDLDKL